jgi:hypothetical protein
MNLQGMMDMLLNPTNGAAAMLIGLVILGLFAAFRAQKQEDFTWTDALRDSQGKTSGFRIGIILSLVMSSWVLVVATLKAQSFTAKELTDLILIYLVIWSGSPIASKALDFLLLKYTGKATTTTETSTATVTSTATETKEKT